MKIIILFLCTGLLFSCTKESFTNSPDALLQTSMDSLHFDTVFTTTGSVTQSFKIINTNTKGIHISSVKLAGGAASPFKMNVNGQAGPQVNNIDINGNDSAYVFTSVTINLAATALPFIIRDSIEIDYNGNKSWVQLDAYGQNAHFLKNRIVTGNEIWNNDLPYVIIGKLTVNTKAQLTINKGCKIFVHADAPVIINGTLNVGGEKWDSTRVIFSGDRLDDPYKDYPASWPGIIFSDSSINNMVQYAIIKNAYQAVVVQNPSANNHPKLILNETIIDNAYDAGLLSVSSSISGTNLLISNCGKNMILAGGSYQFTHCTIAAYGNDYVKHENPALFLTNYINQNTPAIDLNAVFRNCIIWGDNSGLVKSEVATNKVSGAAFNISFNSVLWPPSTDASNITSNGTISDPPQFDSINTVKRYYNFRLQSSSPAINKGVNANVTIDLDGNSRPIGLPDIGCYEKQ